MSLTMNPCRISEASYCAPWDLKIQEEKFKILNEKHLSNTQLYPLFNLHKSKKRTYSVPKLSGKKTPTHRELSPPVLPPVPTGGFIPSCQCSNIESSNSFLFTSKSSSQMIITSPCHHLNIDRYFWYHNGITRRQAENILESHPSGSFLVRQSESGNQNDYSLSIKTTNGCMHMRICYLNGFYILGECSRPFSSVSCMIEYFTHRFVPIRGAPHIKLGRPVLRWETSSSSLLSNKEFL